MKISKVKAIDLIRGSKGKVFGVTFIKRTNGEERTMNARLGVKKGVTGEGLKFDPKQYALIPVYEMPKQQIRCKPAFVPPVRRIPQCREGAPGHKSHQPD